MCTLSLSTKVKTLGGLFYTTKHRKSFRTLLLSLVLNNISVRGTIRYEVLLFPNIYLVILIRFTITALHGHTMNSTTYLANATRTQSRLY